MNIRVLFPALFAFLSSQAHASFELALVCDNASHEIDRYDTQTGIYLGSFGRSVLTSPTDISIDQANGVAWAADYSTGRLDAFDYSTGNFIGSIASAAGAYYSSVLSDGTLLGSYYGTGGTVNRYTTGGSILQSFTTGAVYMEGHYQAADGTIWFLDGQTHSLFSGTTSSNTVTNRLTFTGTGTYAYINGLGNQFVVQSYTSGSASRTMRSFTVSGTTILTNQSVGFTMTTDYVGGGTAVGHGGLVYGVGYSPNGSTMVTWLPGTSFYQTTALNQTVAATGMAVVVAPEPATLGVLAAGLGILIRKRRR